MRIAHVVNYFMPDLGYTEYYVATKQQEMGHEVCVITSDLLSSSSNERYPKNNCFTKEGVRVFRLPVLFKLSHELFISVSHFRRCMNDFSPDIVHVYGALSHMAFMSALCKSAFGYKIVADVITGMVIAHGLSLHLKSTLLNFYSKTMWPYMFKKIDGFFVCSEAAMNWMQNELDVDPSKTHFVPLGADKELFRFNPVDRLMVRKKLGFDDDDVVAIYTGKLLPYKRIDTLIYASAPLLKEGGTFRLLILGDGPCDYVNSLKAITTDLKITSSVLFHGAVHRTELPSFYSAADFAVWPSHHSISMIEAMSTGLPLIIARSNWTNHLLEYQNGFSYPEGDATELHKCICILLNNAKLRREMGLRGRELVEKELNWNTIAEQYLKLYNSVIEKRN